MLYLSLFSQFLFPVDHLLLQSRNVSRLHRFPDSCSVWAFDWFIFLMHLFLKCIVIWSHYGIVEIARALESVRTLFNPTICI